MHFLFPFCLPEDQHLCLIWWRIAWISPLLGLIRCLALSYVPPTWVSNDNFLNIASETNKSHQYYDCTLSITTKRNQHPELNHHLEICYCTTYVSASQPTSQIQYHSEDHYLITTRRCLFVSMYHITRCLALAAKLTMDMDGWMGG